MARDKESKRSKKPTKKTTKEVVDKNKHAKAERYKKD